MNNYVIRFKSLRSGTLYTLNILGGSGAAIELTGGNQPFVTQEDDSDDMFQAVRTQSGYINIFDNGKAADGVTSFDWTDLIPATDLSRPVTLRDGGGTILWQGYMQSQDFGQTLYGNPQERQFPVQCMLSALSSETVDGSERQMHNFAYLLNNAFSIITGLTINHFYFQGGDVGMLRTLVDWQNIVEEDSDGNINGRFDYLSLLEEICKFWGWTMRQAGQDILFCEGDYCDGNNVVELRPSELAKMADGFTPCLYYPTWPSKSIGGDVFANTESKEYYVRGNSKAILTADTGDMDSTIFEAFPQDVMEDMSSSYGYGEPNIEYSDDVYSFSTPYVAGSCAASGASFNLARTLENESYRVIRMKQSYNGSTLASIALSFAHAYYITSPTSFIFQQRRGILIKFDMLSEGRLYEEYDDYGYTKGRVIMRVGIGVSRNTAQWYNGYGWSNFVDDFYVRMPKSGSGYVVMTDATCLYGRLFIEFLGSDNMPEVGGEGGPRKFDIANLKVEFKEDFIEWWTFGIEPVALDTTHTYVKRNSAKVNNEWSGSTIFASDNKTKRGCGIVINQDGSRLTTWDFHGVYVHPEQRMVDRVANYWATSRRKVYAELDYNLVGDVSPLQRVSIAGVSGHPTSVSHDWRDDILKLTVMDA